MTPSCPHGVTGPDALREAVAKAIIDACLPYEEAAAAIAAVRAYDAAHVAAPVAVPAGGRDLAGDVRALLRIHVSGSGAVGYNPEAIAAELMRLGWTCAGSGAGAVAGPLDLLPCPFCGGPAFDDFDDPDGSGHIVGCSNDVCEINPEKFMDNVGVDRDVRIDLARAWNTRAKS